MASSRADVGYHMDEPLLKRKAISEGISKEHRASFPIVEDLRRREILLAERERVVQQREDAVWKRENSIYTADASVASAQQLLDSRGLLPEGHDRCKLPINRSFIEEAETVQGQYESLQDLDSSDSEHSAQRRS
jgi:hypothetical protein